MPYLCTPLLGNTNFVLEKRKVVVRQLYSLEGDPRVAFQWKVIERTIEKKRKYYDYENRFPIRMDALGKHEPFVCKGVKKEERVYGINLAPGFRDVPFFASPTDKLSLIGAFRKRLGPMMPTPDVDFDDFGKFVNEVLQWGVDPLPFMPDQRAVLEKWLTHNHSYSEVRKGQVRAAHVTVSERTGKKLRKNDFKMLSHIKCEPYPEMKFPRYINSRPDNYKGTVGGFIHLAEEVIFHKSKLARFFVKGKRIDEMPELMKDIAAMAHHLGTDYKSFESGFNPRYTDMCECMLWRHVFKNNPIILDFVMECYFEIKYLQLAKDGPFRRCYVPRTEVLHNKLYVIRVIGTRMSGDMWTSLANGFSNLMNSLYIAKQHGLDWKNMKLLVEGDDGIMGLTDPIFTKHDYEQFGFKIDMVYTQDFTKQLFCGNLFDPVEGRTIISTEQIMRTFWTVASMYFRSGDVKKNCLLRSKAMSLFCLGKYTPIASALALKLLDVIGIGGEIVEPGNAWWETQIRDVYANETFKPVEISYRSRMLFASKFNVPINEQIQLESQISKCQKLEDFDFPYWLLRTSYDVGDYIGKLK